MDHRSLDIEQPGLLLGYLRETGRIGPDEPVEIRPLTGGVSNRTVLVRRPGDEAWVIKQALDRLRVATEWRSDPRRVHREAAGLRCLARIIPEAVTPFVFEDFEHHLFAMAAVPEPHENWKQQLLSGTIQSACVEQFASLLARIHRFGYEHADALAREFADRSFFESLRVEPYYEYSARQSPRATSFIRKLIEDCLARRRTLVHGDYSPKNILVHAGRLVLLDHEVIHFGDGTFDVCFALTHLLSKAHHLPGHRESFATAARRLWDVYRRETCDVDHDGTGESMAVRHTLGCLLARAVGRSPLEYLSEVERCRQVEVVTDLMQAPPADMPQLIEDFVQRL